VQTEEALVVGFVGEPSTVAVLHLLQGRLQSAGSNVRVLLVDSRALLEALGARQLPSIRFFRGGKLEAEVHQEASLQTLLEACTEALGVMLQ